MALAFEWDMVKAEINLAKHGVSFPEAQGVFADPFLIEMPDADHSDEEERFVAMGLSYRGRLLVVVFTEVDGRLRIISARRAVPSEMRAYEEGR